MREYEIVLEFPNGVLSNKPNPVQQAFNDFVQKATGKKPKKTVDIQTDKTRTKTSDIKQAFNEFLSQEANDKVYKTSDGKFGIPSTWIRASLVRIAMKTIKEQIGNAKIKWTEYFQRISVDPEVSPITPQQMRPRIDRAVLHHGMQKSQVATIRAEFPKCQTTFNIKTSDDIPETIFKEVLSEAGLLGVGDWRTAGFGAFKVLSVQTK